MEGFSLYLLLFVTPLVLIAVAAYSFRFREYPAAVPFGIALILCACWSAAYGLDATGMEISTKLALLRARLALNHFLPPVIIIFTFLHIRRSEWLKPWVILGLFALPTINALLLVSNTTWTLSISQVLAAPTLRYGPLYWEYGNWGIFMLVYSNLVGLIGTMIFTVTLFTSRGIFFKQTLLIALAMLLPFLLNLFFVTGQYTPIEGINLAPSSMLITGLLSGWALFRYQFFSIIPMARNLAVEEMGDAILITDKDARLVDFNLAARQLFAITTRHLTQPVASILPQWEKLNRPNPEATPRHEEISLVHQGQEIAFETSINLVRGQGGQNIGYVITLREITSRKQTEENLRKRLKELEIINAISVAATSQQRLDGLVTFVGRKLEEIFHVRSVIISVLDRDKNLILTPFRTIDHVRVPTEPMNLGDGLTSIILQTGKRLLIDHDFERKAIELNAHLDYVGVYGMPCSWLGVPVIAGGETIGMVCVQDYDHTNAFSEEDIRLLETIAANIGISIQNAYLLETMAHELEYRKQAEAAATRRAEQMSAINAIGRAITSGLELDNVLTELRMRCQQVAPSMDVFTVALYNEQTYSFKFLQFYDQGRLRTDKTRDIRTKDGGVTAKVITTQKTIYLPDVLEPETIHRHAILHSGEKRARSYLGIPLLIGERVIGVLSGQSYHPNAFSPEQVQFLETIALQAAAALENASLYEETRKHAQELESLYDISLTLSSNLDLPTVLKRLFIKCHQVLPMDAFYVALYDEETNTVTHPLFWDDGQFLTTPQRDIRSTPGMSGEVILSRKTLYIPDVSLPEIKSKYQIIHSGGKKANCYVGVPMVVHERVIGVISMQTHEPDRYKQEQIRLLETIASQAAMAIENSRLYLRAKEELEFRRQNQDSLEKANINLQVQLNQVEIMQDELREQAIRDPLTGLHNRRYLDEQLALMMKKASEESSKLVIIMIDLDHFKNFNDTYGHAIGDKMLQTLAALLRDNTRTNDITCRYGGEEFLLVLGNTNVESGYRRAEELRRAFEQTRLPYKNRKLHSSISLGISVYPDHGEKIEDLVMRADLALYEAKAAGRNRVMIWKK